MARFPKDRDLHATDIPSTYVPARNTVFLSLALAWAEVVGAAAIVIGVNAIDYSGYPDCRPEYLEAFERLASLATRAGRRRPAAADPRAARPHVQGGDHQAGPGARRRLRPDAQLLRSGARRPAVRPLRQLPAARRSAFARRVQPIPDPSVDPVTERLYYTDAYLREFDATIVDVASVEGAPALRSSIARPSIRRPAASRSTPARWAARA